MKKVEISISKDTVKRDSSAGLKIYLYEEILKIVESLIEDVEIEKNGIQETVIHISPSEHNYTEISYVDYRSQFIVIDNDKKRGDILHGSINQVEREEKLREIFGPIWGEKDIYYFLSADSITFPNLKTRIIREKDDNDFSESEKEKEERQFDLCAESYPMRSGKDCVYFIFIIFIIHIFILYAVSCLSNL